MRESKSGRSNGDHAAPRLAGPYAKGLEPVFRAELAARYRAIKKMAKDAEYHGLELDMFAGEQIAERAAAMEKVCWGKDPAIWFSKGYEILSDYGRSFVRPLGWWLAVLAVSAVGYLFVSDGDRTPGAEMFCDNSGGIFGAAFAVSAQKSLLSFGVGRGDGLDGQLGCLFGVETVQYDSTREKTLTLPDLPPAYTIIVLLQTIASAALLFLFFLGVRNRFRIK